MPTNNPRCPRCDRRSADMPTDRERAEQIAINALGWNDRAELDPGEKLCMGMVAADVERALHDARAEAATTAREDERRRVGRALITAEEGTAPGEPYRVWVEARILLDDCRALAREAEQAGEGTS